MAYNLRRKNSIFERISSKKCRFYAAGIASRSTQITVLQQSNGPTQFVGRIMDHTGKPLSGVRVNISRTPLTVTTDLNGDFAFLDQVHVGRIKRSAIRRTKAAQAGALH